ncbi:helix-turn-helix domain-containing protein [uncultured Alsobacter sp.]|uniref:IclR family transcriptional regulator n=1 Tax=uncultured Alsobacter sp. TaxID=1748258 RepID=UPI0025D487D0|nr:helix-turn-helix domain-containing protein [uncultured Alsobacter sp.]
MGSLLVKSATRAIEVLESFKLGQQPRSMSELASALGYPHSSMTVLLKTLVKLGYLNFDRRSRVYFPTPKVTALGDWIPRVLFGSGKILEAMKDLHAATGEGVFLGTRNDVYLQYVTTIPSIHALRFHIDEGTIRPITRSAAGWMLLTDMSDEQVDNIVRRANIATPDAAERVPVREIMDRLREIRARGYAHAENVPFLGGGTLAVLLPVKIQGQPAVLAVGGVAQRIRSNFDQYLTALQAAASALAPTQEFDEPVRIDL